MKRGFLYGLVLVATLLPAGMIRAESPVNLSHTLISYTEGTDSVTLCFLLRVENPSNTSLYNLTLSYVPLTIISQGGVPLYISNIEAGGSRDIPFSVVTPMLLNQEEFLKQSLFWAGKGFDEVGNPVDFSVESRATKEGI